MRVIIGIIRERDHIQSAGNTVQDAAEEACQEIFGENLTGQQAITYANAQGIYFIEAEVHEESLNDISAWSNWEGDRNNTITIM